MERDRRIDKIGLACIHQLPLVLMRDKSVPGILLYMHEIENNVAICHEMNGYVPIVENSDNDLVHGVAYVQATRLAVTPEFRAAFLVSLEVRKRIYNFLGGIRKEEDVINVVHCIVAIILDTWMERRVYDEMYSVFGMDNVKRNIRASCGNIRFPMFSDPVDIGQHFKMLELRNELKKPQDGDAAYEQLVNGVHRRVEQRFSFRNS